MHSTFELVEGCEAPVTDLITLAALKLELGLTTDDEDEANQARIERDSKLIAEWCDRIFALSDAVETFAFERCETAGVGQALTLKLYPVAAIDGITVDGVALEDDEFTLDADTGRLWRVDAAWQGDVVVTYSGGYDLPDAAPAGLQAAIIESVRQRRIMTGRDPTIRETTHGDTHVGFFSEPATGMGGLPESVTALLRPYRRLAAV